MPTSKQPQVAAAAPRKSSRMIVIQLTLEQARALGAELPDLTPEEWERVLYATELTLCYNLLKELEHHARKERKHK